MHFLLDERTVQRCLFRKRTTSIILQVMDPVCGTDGQLYNNACELMVSACNRRVGLEVAYEGECNGK